MELDQVLKNTAKKRATIKKKRPPSPVTAAMDERPYQNDIPKSEPFRSSSDSPMGTRAIVTGLVIQLAIDACDLAKEKTQERLKQLRSFLPRTRVK